MKLLEGKCALVTGAGRGIGKNVAIALARAGAKIVVNDLGTSVDGVGTDGTPAQMVVDKIRADGGQAVANCGSVSEFSQAEAMVNQVVDKFGRIDILVNVAGILRDRMIFNMTEEEWDSVIAVHLKGAFNTISVASKKMREQKSGRIINMSSVSAFGYPGQPNYAAAKSGINALTWATAKGLAKYNVTANAVMPRGDTRMIDNTPDGKRTFEQTGKWPSELAIGTWADPEHNASLVVALASDQAQSINGQIFRVWGSTYVVLKQPEALAALRTKGAWDPAMLAEALPSVLGHLLKPAPEDIGPEFDKLQESDWQKSEKNTEFWAAP